MTDREAFEDFATDVVSAAPAVGEALRRAEVPLAPDMEVPVLWVASIGRAVVESFDRLTRPQRHAVFGSVEHHLSTGSELLRTALTTGLLEVVSDAVDTGVLAADEVAALLGPASRAYVDAWDQFSLGRSTLDPTGSAGPAPDVRRAPATDAAPARAGSRRRPRWRRRWSCR